MNIDTTLRWADHFALAYPLQDDLWIKSLSAKQMDDNIVACLELAPGRPGMIRLNVPAHAGRNVTGLTISETFFSPGPEPCLHELDMTPEFEDGSGTRYTLRISCYPSRFYAASGLLNHPDAIILHATPNLHFQPPIETAPPSLELSAGEMEFAMQEWGSRVGVCKEAGDYAVSQALATAIAATLAPHNGVPSNAMMAASPFEQYRRMKAGQGKGYCENWAVIFVDACKAMDIPARAAWLSQPLQKEDKLVVQYGSSHLTTEIFDRRRNQWIWIDPRFHALGAWLGEEGPLNLAEFCLFLNQPHRRHRLRLAIQQPGDTSSRMLPLDECPKRSFECFEEWGMRMDYRKDIHLVSK